MNSNIGYVYFIQIIKSTNCFSYIYTVFRFNGIINNVFSISQVTEKYTKKYDTKEYMHGQDLYAIKSK